MQDEVLDSRFHLDRGRWYEWSNNALVTLHNFHEKPAGITIDAGDKTGYCRLINLVVGELR